METQKQIHCTASISYRTSGTHQQYWIQHWNEVDASGTSYRYNENCNISAPTKKYNRKARISLQWCTRSRGCYQNLLQDLRKSSTAQNTATEMCDGSSSGKPSSGVTAADSYNSLALLSVLQEWQTLDILRTASIQNRPRASQTRYEDCLLWTWSVISGPQTRVRTGQFPQKFSKTCLVVRYKLQSFCLCRNCQLVASGGCLLKLYTSGSKPFLHHASLKQLSFVSNPPEFK